MDEALIQSREGEISYGMKGPRIDSGSYRHGGSGQCPYSTFVDVVLGLRCEAHHRESSEILFENNDRKVSPTPEHRHLPFRAFCQTLTFCTSPSEQDIDLLCPEIILLCSEVTGHESSCGHCHGGSGTVSLHPGRSLVLPRCS